MPAREIGYAEITHLSGPDEGVDGFERFLKRGRAVPLVHLVEIDVIGPQPPQACLALRDDVETGQSLIVRPGAHRKPDLGRNNQPVAPAVERFAENLLRSSLRIGVGGVHRVDARIEADVEQALRARNVGRAPLRKGADATERRRAKGERGELEARAAKKPVFHGDHPSCLAARLRLPQRFIFANPRESFG